MDRDLKKKIIRVSASVLGLLLFAVFTLLLTQYAKNTSRSIEAAALANYIKSDLTWHYYFYNRYPDKLVTEPGGDGKTIVWPDFFSSYTYSMLSYSACNDDLSECGSSQDNPQNFKLEFNLNKKPFKGVERVVVTR